MRRHRGRWVNLDEERVVKFFPRNPPRKGEIVLVDDVRCEVRRANVTWDGARWTLHALMVRPSPAAPFVAEGTE